GVGTVRTRLIRTRLIRTRFASIRAVRAWFITARLVRAWLVIARFIGTRLFAVGFFTGSPGGKRGAVIVAHAGFIIRIKGRHHTMPAGPELLPRKSLARTFLRYSPGV